jgi:hypothetical protein
VALHGLIAVLVSCGAAVGGLDVSVHTGLTVVGSATRSGCGCLPDGRSGPVAFERLGLYRQADREMVIHNGAGTR